VTVAICTRNRAGILARSVAATAAEARAAGGEVLIVDNASTDDTPAVAARLSGESVRAVREAELGLSAARNRALADARGDVVAFLDDDAVPRAGWLAALAAAYASPAVAAAGGPIRLAFETPPPAWLLPALHGALSAYDLGPAPRRVRYGEADYPYGANVSVRVADARAAGGFSTRFGLRGAAQLQHEEIDLCYRLDAAGREVRYVPDAVVDHWIAAERLTPAWFLERHRRGGESAALFVLRHRGVARALWRIRWLYGAALLRAPYAPVDPVDGARFANECRRQEALGYVAGLVRALPQLGALRAARRDATVWRPVGGEAVHR
jgi:glycosyltransferase involved in cell wall biosynthesis